MTAQYRLAARLDSQMAPVLSAELGAREKGDLTIDASDTELLGTLAQQVLASAARTWRAKGHDFRISGVSPRVRDQIEVLGLDPVLLAEGEEQA